MELSVKLTLDSSAFRAGVESARKELGALGAAAAVPAKAAAGSAGVPGGAEDAARHARDAAEASKEKAEADSDAAAAIQGAAAAARMLPGPLGEAAGKAASLASGAKSAAKGMEALGASAAMAAKGVLALGLVAAVAEIAMALKEAHDAQEDFAASNALANAAAAAESASRAYSRLREEISLAAQAERGMSGAASEARRIGEARQLADLERERYEALAAKPGDAASVNAEFDARRASMEAGFRRAADAETLAGLQSSLAENRRLAAEAKAAMDAAGESAAGHMDRAMGWSGKSLSAMMPWDKERYSGYAADETAAGRKDAERRDSLRSELARLDAEARELEARISAESGRGALRDAEEAAAEAKARAGAAARDEAANANAGAPDGGPAARMAEADRLARIGGSLGADYAAANRAKMQYDEARRSREILERIERKLDGVGAAVFA